jgi:hypothetical protein
LRGTKPEPGNCRSSQDSVALTLMVLGGLPAPPGRRTETGPANETDGGGGGGGGGSPLSVPFTHESARLAFCVKKRSLSSRPEPRSCRRFCS